MEKSIGTIGWGWWIGGVLDFDHLCLVFASGWVSVVEDGEILLPTVHLKVLKWSFKVDDLTGILLGEVPGHILLVRALLFSAFVIFQTVDIVELVVDNGFV